MNQDERKNLIKLLAQLAAYYQKPVPDFVLGMYADDLNGLGYEKVVGSLHAYRSDPKNRTMPLPAQIKAILKPVPDAEIMAREICARIIHSVTNFGYTWPKEAREHIGDIGWSIVQTYGGWESFCRGLGHTFSIDSFNAQAREVIKGRIMHGEALGQMAIAIPYGKPSHEQIEENENSENGKKLLNQLGLIR